MNIINRMICKSFGHKRGKQYGMQVMQPDGRFCQMYQRSRCGAVWTRKLPNAKEPTNGN